MIHRAKTQQGFTLVELLFALAFIGFILVFAVTTVVQVMTTYNKGLAIKQINQGGRTTLEDLARYLRSVDPNAITVVSSANRACFGGISYVWNLWDTPAGSANKYDDNSVITLTRVNDPGRAMCSNVSGNYPDAPKAQATDVLFSNVWVMGLTITPQSGGRLIDISIQLAVANDPAISGGTCAVGGTAGQFCATSMFSTTVRTGGGN